MIRMLLLTLLFFFSPPLLMFAAHRAIMLVRFWWQNRQYHQQESENIIDITPTDHGSIRPSGVFIAASMIVATACAFIAWQSIEKQPLPQKSDYAPAYLDASGQLVPAETQPLPSNSTISLKFSGTILRLPPPVSNNTAVYVNIHNNKDQAVTIVGINSPIAMHVMMHGMNKNNGMMHMFAIKQLTILAKTTAHFSIGKQHIMLMGLKRELKLGEKISIELVLANGKKQSFLATVTDLR